MSETAKDSWTKWWSVTTSGTRRFDNQRPWWSVTRRHHQRNTRIFLASPIPVSCSSQPETTTTKKRLRFPFPQIASGTWIRNEKRESFDCHFAFVFCFFPISSAVLILPTIGEEIVGKMARAWCVPKTFSRVRRYKTHKKKVSTPFKELLESVMVAPFIFLFTLRFFVREEVVPREQHLCRRLLHKSERTVARQKWPTCHC